MTQSPPPPRQPGPMVGPDLPGATAGLVLGILSIALAEAAIVGLVLGFIGLQKSREARRVAHMNPGIVYPNAGVAQAGYVCSIIGLILSGLALLTCCAWVAVAAIVGALSAA